MAHKDLYETVEGILRSLEELRTEVYHLRLQLREIDPDLTPTPRTRPGVGSAAAAFRASTEILQPPAPTTKRSRPPRG